MTGLDLEEGRPVTLPKDAATVILVRENDSTLEVFCVERHPKSGFLGGAIVFPGGKLDDADGAQTWTTLASAPSARTRSFTETDERARAFAVAACRETLEEAALLLAKPSGASAPATNDEVAKLQSDIAGDAKALAMFLEQRGLALDLGALVPFSRWITPIAEGRRFDARFFLARAPEGQTGAHDTRETVSSFWAPPSAVLARFLAGEVQLAPPTHATLAVLAEHGSIDRAFAYAADACLDPICPLLVQYDGTVALALPGDPAHEVREPRCPGLSRYVLRDAKWLPENPA